MQTHDFESEAAKRKEEKPTEVTKAKIMLNKEEEKLAKAEK